MTNSLETLVAAQMREHHVPGLSLAVVGTGSLVNVQAHGFTDQTERVPITTDTLFQAASISKCLAALAALRLVDQGRLALDEGINARLRSWKIPASDVLDVEQISLRRLLSHNAGFNVHGFSGYARGEAVPTLVQIFNGTPPAKNPPLRVEAIPAGQSRYSGGGYTVLQQLLMDVTGQSFPELMQTLVLEPLGLAGSTFAQPLPPQLAANAATGHDSKGSAIPGGAHVYPEMAAAGLWTTPADLARFVIGLQQACAGQSDALLSPALAREMLTPQTATHGLGPFVSGTGKALKFFHSGRNAGFDGLLVGTVVGRGAVIMMNANAGSSALNVILNAIVREQF
jgi:CubicO group peptidase (beta-lactamase class C family)